MTFTRMMGVAVMAAFLVHSPVASASGQPETKPTQPQAAATPVTPPDVTTKLRLSKPPKPDVMDKKIFVNVVDSDKGTALVRARLDALGFKTVDAADVADLTLRIGGNFSVTGAGKQRVNGKLGELLNGALPADAGRSPDYTHQNINLLQIAGSTAGTGTLSVSQLVTWLGQKTGISGRINEAITGDPRGWCIGDTCDKRENNVTITVNTGDYGHWWLDSKATDTRIVLDYCLADALDKMLQPLVELSSKSAVALGTDDPKRDAAQ